MLYLGFLSLLGILHQVTVADLRRTNAWAAALFPFICRSVLRGVAIDYDGIQLLDRTLPWLWSLAEINHAVLNICLFPPLFFFLGLYYTDVWSALSVLITIRLHQKMATKYLVLAGIISLFFRQTNIFWVAVYLGGLEVARRLRRGRLGFEYVPSATWSAVVSGSWQNLCIYDPLIAQASFEGIRHSTGSVRRCILITICRLCQNRTVHRHSVRRSLWDSAPLLEALYYLARRFRILYSVEWRCGPR